MAAGIALMAVGVLGLVTPGPGLIGVAAGAVLVAEESYAAASLFDRVEIAVRRGAAPAVRWWREATPAVRGGTLAAAALVAVGTAVLLWRALAG